MTGFGRALLVGALLVGVLLAGAGCKNRAGGSKRSAALLALNFAGDALAAASKRLREHRSVRSPRRYRIGLADGPELCRRLDLFYGPPEDKLTSAACRSARGRGRKDSAAWAARLGRALGVELVVVAGHRVPMWSWSPAPTPGTGTGTGTGTGRAAIRTLRGRGVGMLPPYRLVVRHEGLARKKRRARTLTLLSVQPRRCQAACRRAADALWRKVVAALRR